MLGTGNSVVGNFRWIQVVNDVVLTALEAQNLSNADPELIGITLPAGLGIGGKFTLIEISGTSTGVVIAYYA